MSDSTTPAAPGFSTDNRAYRRFTAMIQEHFDVVSWTKGDGDPVFVTLIDLATGDSFSLAYLDSAEIDHPAVLLAWATNGFLAAYGPFNGTPAGNQYGRDLAATDQSVAVTQAVPLLVRRDRAIPDCAWKPVMPGVMTLARSAVCDTPSVVGVFFDPDANAVVCGGPFVTTVDAHNWHPILDRDTHQFVLPLRRPAVIPPGIAALSDRSADTIGPEAAHD